MYKCLLITWCLIAFVFAARAQKPDTTASKPKTEKHKTNKDTSQRYVPKFSSGKVYHPDSTHSPHKALIHSAMIPGWGQLYNHRWWKVPLIYGGLGLLGDVVVFNERYYKEFLAEAKLREKGITVGRDPLLVNVSDADVTSYTDVYRRNRDLGILGFIGAWGIQMIDAYVDAKFIQEFTMDNNLSFRIKPGMISQPAYAFSGYNTYIPAVTITFTLK